MRGPGGLRSPVEPCGDYRTFGSIILRPAAGGSAALWCRDRRSAVPLYEYECGACKHRFEQIQKFSDPLVKKCPRCGKKRVKKLPSSPAIQFKGSGFYITDY